VLIKITETEYLYKREDNAEFKLSRLLGAGWTRVQVGDVLLLKGKHYKVTKILPTEVKLLKLEDKK